MRIDVHARREHTWRIATQSRQAKRMHGPTTDAVQNLAYDTLACVLSGTLSILDIALHKVRLTRQRVAGRCTVRGAAPAAQDCGGTE